MDSSSSSSSRTEELVTTEGGVSSSRVEAESIWFPMLSCYVGCVYPAFFAQLVRVYRSILFSAAAGGRVASITLPSNFRTPQDELARFEVVKRHIRCASYGACARLGARSARSSSSSSCLNVDRSTRPPRTRARSCAAASTDSGERWIRPALAVRNCAARFTRPTLLDDNEFRVVGRNDDDLD